MVEQTQLNSQPKRGLSVLMSAAFLVHASNATITTLIGIIIALRGGSQSEVATIAAFYAVGFLAGCFMSPAFLRMTGHIRGFASAAAAFTITITLFELSDSAVTWAISRFFMGVAIAMVLAVSDSWMNNNAASDKRGRVIAIYSIVMGLSSIASQSAFLLLDSEDSGFALLFAVAVNVAVMLVTVSATNVPEVKQTGAEKLRFFTKVPKVAGLNAFVAGFSSASFVALIPFYMASNGVTENLVAMFMGMFFVGRLAFMYPIGSLSDRLGRRSILIVLSSVVIVLAALGMIFGEGEARWAREEGTLLKVAVAFLWIFLIGGAMSPVYSIASALAFDEATHETMVQASTTMLGIQCVGSVIGPFFVILIGPLVGDYASLLCVVGSFGLGLAYTWLKGAPAVAPEDSVEEVVSETEAATATATNAIPTASIAMAQAAANVVEEKMDPQTNMEFESTEPSKNETP